MNAMIPFHLIMLPKTLPSEHYKLDFKMKSLQLRLHYTI